MQCRVGLLIFIAALTINAATAGETLPELTIVDHVEHYQVTGATYRTIQAQLESRSEIDGNSRHGSTRSTFKVISKLEKVNGWCRVLRQEIVVNITIVLPQWEPSRNVNSGLHEQWDKSFERLARHENGHRQNVLQAAADLRERLAELERKERCLSARASIDLELGNALDRLERREAYYDRLTRNGQRDFSAAVDPLNAGLEGKQSLDAFSKLRSERSRKFPAE